jgi:methylmalonyl-CoA carboxyltransferase small subunit
MRKEILSIMPGLVARVNCKVGDEVRTGDVVAVLNVMKQEIEVKATENGRVKEILVKEWDEMDVDTPMIILE